MVHPELDQPITVSTAGRDAATTTSSSEEEGERKEQAEDIEERGEERDMELAAAEALSSFASSSSAEVPNRGRRAKADAIVRQALFGLE